MVFRNSVLLHVFAAVFIYIVPIAHAARNSPNFSQDFIVYSEDDPVALEDMPQAVEEKIVVTVGRVDENDNDGFPLQEDSEDHLYGEGTKFIEEFEVLDENEARLRSVTASVGRPGKAGVSMAGPGAGAVVSASRDALVWLRGMRKGPQ